MRKFVVNVLKKLQLKMVLHGLGQLTLIVDLLICRYAYARVLWRIRRRPKGTKVRVLFLVNELAKWKCQPVYDEMKTSALFEPIIVLAALGEQSRCSVAELERLKRENSIFFKAKGCDCECAYTLNPRANLDFKVFRPDIVFFPEPWLTCFPQTTRRVSKFALACYVPYFVPNYGDVWLDSHQHMHLFLHTHFVLNENWAKLYESSFGLIKPVQKFVAVGHPSLDNLECVPERGDAVIYAPHWSFPHPRHNHIVEFYSTFEWSGKKMLEYAKSHPEIKWLFKPHPILRRDLEETGLMSKQEVDAYYAEWERIGETCYTADYQEMFKKSRLMITDCGSFLTEYGATGKPIIHLIQEKNDKPVLLPSRMLYNTYYKVRNLEDLKIALEEYVEKRNDPNRDVRLMAVQDAGLVGGHASQNILRYLQEVVKYE